MPTLPAHDARNLTAPHLVILGAGASRAALPKGDASGQTLPLMKDFVQTLGLGPLLTQHGVELGEGNFESTYDSLVSSGSSPALVRFLEERVYRYFQRLRLPSRATIYDFLILSLREKDVIATFNWDPFLMQACERNMRIARPPHVLWLHGNVACGLCHECKYVGSTNQECPQCGKPFGKCRLLYPFQHKDYESDPFIAGEWRLFRRFLDEAYQVTVFGYSAPKTDAAARSAMLDAWSRNPSRDLAQAQIADIAPEKQVRLNWQEFFVSHHYDVTKSIRNSWLAWFPRRSCEALYAMTMMCKRTEPLTFPRYRSLERLQEWFLPLIEEERDSEASGSSLLSRYG